ncbi:hypothetical protein [Mesorhizobium sp. M0203]|uniref:ATP-dependent DNA ligase n=1 Tax=Mesorhizobium sp. M0203 TaxID=2956912 RepID=UPI003337CE82
MLTEPGVGRLSFIEFQMPTLVEKPPKGQGWFHEIKYDGYRTQLIIQRGKVQAFTRNGFDWTDRNSPIVRAAAELNAKRAIIDGEATVLGTTGRPDLFARPIIRSPGRIFQPNIPDCCGQHRTIVRFVHGVDVGQVGHCGIATKRAVLRHFQ